MSAPERPRWPDGAWRDGRYRHDAAAEAYMGHLEARIAELEVERERLRAALEMIAGERPCIDALMGDKDIAHTALKAATDG